MMATKEDVDKINEALNQLVQQFQGLTTRVENVEKIPSTPPISVESIKKIQEKVNKISKEHNYYEDSDLGILVMKG